MSKLLESTDGPASGALESLSKTDDDGNAINLNHESMRSQNVSTHDFDNEYDRDVNDMNLERSNENHLNQVPFQYVYPDAVGIANFFGCCKERRVKKCPITQER
jgi:hypothetical protein